MGFFDKNKALIITVLLFSIMVLAMVNIHLSNSDQGISSTLIDLANVDLLEPEEKEKMAEIPEQVPQPKPTSVETHQAYNQDQKKNNDVDSRLQEIFEKNAAQAEASEEESSRASGEFNISRESHEEKTERSDGDNSTDEVSARSGSLKNSSISFSLLGRSALDIPNPIYTCDTSGKVVVNITVNSEGAVVRTSINEASSSSSNECLTARALEYAASAIFSELPGRNSQPGTITYNFQG